MPVVAKQRYPGIMFRARCAVVWFACVMAVSSRAQDGFKAAFRGDSAELQPAELSQILAALCPDKGFIGEKSACHSCPVGSAGFGHNGDFTVGSGLRGHFVKRDSEDWLIGTEGCEPHAARFGGSVLFSRTNGAWHISRKYSPGPIGLCRKVVNRLGIDGLVCYNDDRHFNAREGWLSFRYVFADHEAELARWYDNMNSACVGQKPLAFVQSEIVKAEFGHDERGDPTLIVDQRCRKGSLARQTPQACERGDLDQAEVAGPFRSYRVEYRFDGEQFSLIPSSVATKRELDVCLDPTTAAR